jgi:hypothetical protein
MRAFCEFQVQLPWVEGGANAHQFQLSSPLAWRGLPSRLATYASSDRMIPHR